MPRTQGGLLMQLLRRCASLAVLTALVLPAAAMAAPGSVSGTVNDANGAVGGICAAAFQYPGSPAAAQVDTQVDGTYSLPNLAPGIYFVGFSDCHVTPPHYADAWSSV